MPEINKNLGEYCFTQTANHNCHEEIERVDRIFTTTSKTAKFKLFKNYKFLI